MYLPIHCGSLEYASPELVKLKDHEGPEADVWALGVCLYCMCYGYFPFHSASTEATVNLIVHANPKMPEHFSELLIDLLLHMLRKRRQNRCSLADALQHEWCSGSSPTIQLAFRPPPPSPLSAKCNVSPTIPEPSGSSFRTRFHGRRRSNTTTSPLRKSHDVTDPHAGSESNFTSPTSPLRLSN